jgi:hypothetical protein
VPDELKIDFGDGVSALDRAERAIVLMFDGAIAELLRMGYRRDFDHITVVVDADAPYVEMRGEPVYGLSFVTEGTVISIQGHWLKRPRKRSWIRRWLSKEYRAGAS